MKSDYLWDGSGEPDPELQKLERALGQFRSQAEAPTFPVDVEAGKQRGSNVIGLAWRIHRLAASVLLGAAALTVALFLHLPKSPTGPGWDVARLEGAPSVGELTVANTGEMAKLRVGQVLTTNATSRASVQVANIGELYVDPGSRVRLLETGSNRKRIAVEVGTIHAAIWAPPGEFVVDTPSATAVDLGCAYTLQVAEDGSGTLRTKMGWVGFHQNGHDSFIPAGAMCLTRAKEGPGTPFFEDSPEEFRLALHALDFGGLSAAERSEALQTVLRKARARDGFTLWHLLARVSDEERPIVYDRLTSLVRPPSGTTREGVLRLDRPMLDVWWNAFDLGDIGVWRFWERREAPQVKKAAG
jgi:FecR-like protein